MNIKTGPDFTGLKKALKKHGIVVSKGENEIEIDAKGLLLEGVFPPPGKDRVRKRIIRFLKGEDKEESDKEVEDEFIDPSSYGFIAHLAKDGPRIVIQPLPK